MQSKEKASWLKHLDFMILDLLSLVGAFYLSYYIKFHTTVLLPGWSELLLIILLLNLVLSLVVNPHSGIIKRRYFHVVRRTFILAAMNALITFVLLYLLKWGEAYSRQIMIVTFVIYFFLTVIVKYVWKKMLAAGLLPFLSAKPITLFIISDKEHALNDVINASSNDMTAYDIKGIYLTDGDTEESIEEVPVIKEEYIRYILDNNIDEVLIAISPSAIEICDYETLIANGVGVNMVVEATIGFQTEEQHIANVGIYKALNVGAFSFSPTQSIYLFIKRIFDIICGLIGLVMLIPITIGVKIANLFSGDKAPIFYRQNRIGLNGKPIRIFKFRSMVPNAEEILQELLKQESYRKEWEENQKFENDPRITKIGRFLRKTSIDELPQLLNVLVGDMSLVGPRPLLNNELEEHGGLKLYQKVKPGITGWWGCNGRSNIDYKERLELEYYYVKHCSFYLDVLCIFRTFAAVLKRDGAK